MRARTVFVGLALVSCCLGQSSVAAAQPAIPKANVPPDIAPKLREHLERLYSRDPVARGEAARSIGDLGSEASVAVPFLASMLDDSSALKWRWQFSGLPGTPTSPGELAGEALARFARAHARFAPSVIEGILSALNDSRAAIGAAVALGALKESRALDRLVALLGAPEPGIRAVAATALGEIGDRRAVGPLIEKLKDGDHQVAASAWNALRAITGKSFGIHFADWESWWAAEGPAWLTAQSPSEFDRRFKDLTEGNWVAKVDAATALGRMRDVRAVQPLLAALGEEHHTEVRKAAALALGDIADARAIRTLTQLYMTDPNDDVRQAARKAVEKIQEGRKH